LTFEDQALALPNPYETRAPRPRALLGQTPACPPNRGYYS
jgi:hypothetical protein